ncbi:MAG: YqgE/AlgH family protein [Bacteroidota bacterium]|jgi:putative transcriptional regulator|nr:YqgE/AlgH family protein [Algoriphagus sp.]
MALSANSLLRPGMLLLSAPFLQDENFVRSVILLCEHENSGSFGLVLNKPSILQLADLVEELSFVETDVFVGGPVEQNTLHFIYFGEKKLEGSVQLGKELWWGGEFDQLVNFLKNKQLDANQVRFFMGYSGWEAGQLGREIEEQTWIICREGMDLFPKQDVSEKIWKLLLKNMGGVYRELANYPLDPRLN